MQSPSGQVLKVMPNAKNLMEAGRKSPMTMTNNFMSGGMRARAFKMPGSVFNQAGGKEKLAKFQLPGDTERIERYRLRSNMNPFLFLPAWLILLFSDGVAYQQETPTLYVNGTLYNGTETHLNGHALSSDYKDTNSENFRSKRDLLYEPDSGAPLLKCKFGKPEQYWMEKRGYWCPLVMKPSGNIMVPIVWFVCFLLAILLAYFKGKKMHQQGKIPAGINDNEKGPRSGITYRVGLCLGVYANGFKDAHLHLAFFGICVLCAHSIASRIFTEMMKGKCLRFGNWDGHWDDCLPLSVAEPGSTLATCAAIIYFCYVGNLWNVKADPIDRKTEPVPKMDNVTEAAVNFKKFVHKQMKDTISKTGSKPKPIGKALIDIVMKVASAVGFDMPGDLGDIAGADFMEGFSEGLDQITALADQAEDMATAASAQATETLRNASDQVVDAKDGSLDKAKSFAAMGMPGQAVPQADSQRDFDPLSGISQAAQQQGADTLQKAQAKTHASANMMSEAAQGQVANTVRSATEEMQALKGGASDVTDAAPYWSVTGPALAGVALGLAIAVLFLVAPTGATSPFRVGSGMGKSKWCTLEQPQWCHGQSLGVISLATSVYYTPETATMFAVPHWQTILLLVLKIIAFLTFGALFGILVNNTFDGLDDAAIPMDVMASILSKWTLERNVTVNQLQAWILARKSFLHNECTMMLKRNEKVLVFFIITLVILVAWQLVMVLIADKLPSAALTVGIALMGFGAIGCVQAAMACYKAQRKHLELLTKLKEGLQGAHVSKKDQRITFIDTIVEGLDRRDYQTKLMFLPLNPLTLKGIVGYCVSAGVFIGGKLAITG
jgi:hypothetical protein